MWNTIRKKSTLFRKGSDFAKQIPRAIKRNMAADEDYLEYPPLLGNSFPKSGTHQLLQVLQAFPSATHWGSFIASTPSISLRERSSEAHKKLINSIVPKEYLGAHLFFDYAFEHALNNLNVAHYFIYRDLRDVAVSEAYYLSNMNSWHKLHTYFSKYLKTRDERIMAVINGIPGEFGTYYPDIGTRMAKFLPWLESDSVFSLKYEDLNSSRREKVIESMIRFYSVRSVKGFNETCIIQRTRETLNPSNSHTFRKGGAGGWRKVLNNKHISCIEERCGSILYKLGYE